MIVSTAKRALVLNLRNPGRVTHVIPSARMFTFRGRNLVAVPHRLDEVRVLRNLGFAAPSPILHHYRWPGRHDPFYAQKMTSQFLTLHSRCFVLNDMGTGKTLSALWAFDYLRKIKRARRMLVIAPLSTLERTWADECFENFPGMRVAIVHGDKARRLKLLADDGYDVWVINHHGISVVEQALIAKQFDIVVVDEGAIFRNSQTKLWKTLDRVVRNIGRIWWMTGTPMPNAPTDVWAQCRIVSPERVPRYFGKFRDMVMRAMGPFRWVPRPDAIETAHDAMQPAIRFTRDECVDLPPTMYVTREVPMTTEQTGAYKQMLSQLYMEYKGGQVTAVNEAVKLSKLLQIACGVVYGKGGHEVVLPNAPRINEVVRIIEEAHTKTIVFVPYKSVLRYVAQELSRILDPIGTVTLTLQTASWMSPRIGMISGDVSATERARIFHAFQKGDIDVLVAQPDAMSHGLTLTAANTIVWYGPTLRNETYQQANARIIRPGQNHSQFIINLESSAVERGAFKRLNNRQKMQGLFLEAVEAETGP
jgi:SNF2 family DNA or RNA helicase